MNRSDDEGLLGLTVHLTTWPEAVVVVAVGDLDLANADGLRQQAEAALGTQPPALVVDLGGITFCGSVGLQVLAELVTATTSANLPFAVVTDRYPVLRAIELTRLDATLSIHPSVDRARTWIRSLDGS